MTERIIIAGFGGQGVMTIGKFTATVAMREGREVIYLPSYGAEVRGGTANCYVIISEEPIYSPVIEVADTIIVLNQPSYDKFRPRLRRDGLLLVNSSMAKPDPALEKSPARVCLIPGTETANLMGNVRVTNVVMMGAYCAIRNLLSPAAVLAEIERELGDGKVHLLEVNRKAFQRGMEMGTK